jgi:hypothetical protein
MFDELCHIVATKHSGSLKGEHGTGRNVAPYVEMEWGACRCRRLAAARCASRHSHLCHALCLCCMQGSVLAVSKRVLRPARIPFLSSVWNVARL